MQRKSKLISFLIRFLLQNNIDADISDSVSQLYSSLFLYKALNVERGKSNIRNVKEEKVTPENH